MYEVKLANDWCRHHLRAGQVGGMPVTALIFLLVLTVIMSVALRVLGLTIIWNMVAPKVFGLPQISAGISFVTVVGFSLLFGTSLTG